MDTNKDTPFQHILDEKLLIFDKESQQQLAAVLDKKNLSVAVAESLTGGMIGERITSLSGSSRYFLGGVICYHPSLKIKLCGVSAHSIRTHGIVSKEVAIEMAKGIQKLCKSDLSIATTGFAETTENSPASLEQAGVVYIGFMIKNEVKTQHFKFEGTRTLIREKTTLAALHYLKQYIIALDE